MKIKRFFETFGNYDYDYKYILDTLCKEYKWGNIITVKIKDFEESIETLPSSNDDYIIQFNKWLFNNFKHKPPLFKTTINVKPPVDWYAKST